MSWCKHGFGAYANHAIEYIKSFDRHGEIDREEAYQMVKEKWAEYWKPRPALERSYGNSVNFIHFTSSDVVATLLERKEHSDGLGGEERTSLQEPV